MHDETLERRVRAALHDEADRLSFTITAAEMERRLALRRRRVATRPTALLFAAAVGIGLVGAAAVAGGWFDREPHPTPTPVPSTLALVGPSSSPEPVDGLPAPSPVDLPTLEDLVHSGPVDDIVLAQASGPESAFGISQPAVPHPSSIELGPLALGLYRVEFGCLASQAGETGGYAVVGAGTPGADPPRERTCDGRMTSNLVPADGPSVLRLALPGASSWRLVVRAASGGTGAHATTPLQPVLGAGEDEIQNASSAVTQLKPGASFGTDAVGDRVVVGAVPFRDRSHFRASCAGPSAIAYHIGFDDPNNPFLPESTTLVPCDGAVHEMGFRPGNRPEPDVLVTAPAGTAWRLLVSADRPPIATARDEAGWAKVISSGPRFGADDLSESIVGRVTGGSRLARVVVSCQGGTSIDVSVGRGDQVGDPVQTFRAACGERASTTIGEPFTPDENGGFTIDAEPHGRMWTAITVQQEDPGSAAP